MISQQFEQFLIATAGKGDAVNVAFEQRLFDLVAILHRITDPLRQANIPHELVGGLAVLVHVEEADPKHSVMTRDVDLMIQRQSLESVISIAREHGFRYSPSDSCDMLLYGPDDHAVNKIRLMFAVENIAPIDRIMHGEPVSVISVADLVRMKLSANRDKDRVHIRSMDAAGLITQSVAESLPPALAPRLQNIRETE